MSADNAALVTMIGRLVQWIEGEGSIVPTRLVAEARKLAADASRAEPFIPHTANEAVLFASIGTRLKCGEPVALLNGDPNYSACTRPRGHADGHRCNAGDVDDMQAARGEWTRVPGTGVPR